MFWTEKWGKSQGWPCWHEVTAVHLPSSAVFPTYPWKRFMLNMRPHQYAMRDAYELQNSIYFTLKNLCSCSLLLSEEQISSDKGKVPSILCFLALRVCCLSSWQNFMSLLWNCILHHPLSHHRESPWLINEGHRNERITPYPCGFLWCNAYTVSWSFMSLRT